MQNITSPPQANAEVSINENFETLQHQQVYGLRQPATTALTWGYYGGRWGGFSVADGTLTLTNTATNYIVVAIATGVISVSTSNTNWNDTTNYARVYQLTVAGGVVTVIADYRAGPGGIFGGGGGGGGGMTNPMTTAADLIVGGVAGAPARLGIGTNGYILTVVAGAVAWAASPGAPVQCIPIACSDEATALTAGVAKVTFRMPFAFTLTAVRASVTTAPTGANLVVDINEGGTTILSTKLSIDATEKTSTTAATPAVISDTSLADDAEITVDIDQIGSTIAGAGLKVYLIGTKT